MLTFGLQVKPHDAYDSYRMRLYDKDCKLAIAIARKLKDFYGFAPYPYECVVVGTKEELAKVGVVNPKEPKPACTNESQKP